MSNNKINEFDITTIADDKGNERIQVWVDRATGEEQAYIPTHASTLRINQLCQQNNIITRVQIESHKYFDYTESVIWIKLKLR